MFAIFVRTFLWSDKYLASYDVHTTYALDGSLLLNALYVVFPITKIGMDRQTQVRLDGLGNLKKKKSTSSGTRIGDLPACSIVPQPITLPRTPFVLQEEA
jgi:hypothetical protein